MKNVCQLDSHGYFVNVVVADSSPLEAGVFLIPGGAIDAPPPSVPDGMRAKWNGSRFDMEDIPQPVIPPAPTLDELKAAKNAEINLARAAANTSTFAHGGKTFSCDQLSRGDIDGVNGYVALFGALPPEFPGAWKAIDNSYHPIADVAAWKAFYASMVAAGSANFVHAQTLKAQLAAATTPAAVAAIVWTP
jgi:hypothetical protein